MIYWDDRQILGVVLFIMILILVLVIGGVIFFIKIITPRRKRTTDTVASIQEILKIRCAKGEISREEYEQLKKDLL